MRRRLAAPALRALWVLGVLLSLAVSRSATAQAAPLDRRVSVQFHDVSLRDALDRVMALARVRISYSAELLPLDRAVRATFDSATLGTVLAVLLRDVAVTAVASSGNQVVLTPVREVRLDAQRAIPALAVGTAELDRVVVTGTATGGTQRSLPVALAIIDGREARRAAVYDIATALDGAVPGIWAWEQSPASLVARYGSIRGASSLGASYPKMYIDGIAVANPLLVTQFDAESVQRIEVIRGPQGAALYGADAISGVLNIVTRHDGVDAGAPRARIRASAGYASTSYAPSAVLSQDHRISVGLGSGLRTADLGLGVTSMGAYYAGASSHSVQASAGGRIVGAHTIVTGTARFVSGAVGTNVNPLLAETLAASDRAVAAGSVTTNGQSLQQYTVGGTVTYAPSERWTHALVVGVDGYSLSNVANDFTPFLSSADSALRAARGAADRTTLRASSVARVGSPDRLAASFTLAAEHTAMRQETPSIQLGRGARMHGPDMGPGGGMARAMPVTSVDWFSDLGLTTQADLALRNTWYLSAGLRLERNTGYVTTAHANLLPMVGAAYVRELGGVTLKLRSAFGRGIRAPRTAARETMLGGFGSQAVVRNLAPEEQSGIEGGLDLMLGRAVTLQVTRFDQRATGLIQQVVIRDSTSAAATQTGAGLALQYQNVGSLDNHGWELQTTVRRGRMSGTLAYTTVDSRVRALASGYTGDLRPGDRMLGVPARTASASVAWSGTRWNAQAGVARAYDWVEYDRLSLAAAYVGFDRATVPLYGLDLRGYWRSYAGNTRVRATVSRAFGRGLTLIVTGENLLDFQRGEPDNATIVPGRTITTGLRLSRF